MKELGAKRKPEAVMEIPSEKRGFGQVESD
jgi:hypothetical protein